MLVQLLRKIASVPSSILTPVSSLPHADVHAVGQQIHGKVAKLFNGSLAIRVVTAGSTNACEQELNALGNAYYDVERFGVHFVASPRHADMIFVTGPVSRNMASALKATYYATPSPKFVVAVGDDAINGGIFKGSYATLDGAHNVVPVDYTIAGDPPSPAFILSSLLAILQDIEQKAK